MDSAATLTLNNGVTIPQIGFGVFQVPPDETQQITEQALEAGYRHIDTAAAYNNETGVGAAIAASGLPRDDLFVTTKLRNGDQGYDSAMRAYDASLERLGLDRIDLYLIHWPYPMADEYANSWRALERIQADGRLRTIGVSNFLPEHLDRIAESSGVTPAVNQIELHPSFQQRELTELCRQRGIAVEAYSPLGRGADLEHPTITTIAEAHQTSAAQVIIGWHLQHGHIVIPKSATPERIRSNRDVDALTLTGDEVAAIDGLEADGRTGGDPRTFSLSQIR